MSNKNYKLIILTTVVVSVLNVTQTEQMISLLPLDNFYPVIPSYRRVQKEKESDELLCAVRSLVTVREPVASAGGVNLK